MTNWYIRFKEIRMKHQYSQADLAENIGVDVTTISRYEKGKGSRKITSNLRLKLKQVFTNNEVAYIEYGEQSKPSQRTKGDGNTQTGGNIKFAPVDEKTYREGKQIGKGLASLMSSIEDGYPFDDPLVSAVVAIMHDFDDIQKAQALQCITEVKLGTKE